MVTRLPKGRQHELCWEDDSGSTHQSFAAAGNALLAMRHGTLGENATRLRFRDGADGLLDLGMVAAELVCDLSAVVDWLGGDECGLGAGQNIEA